METQYRKIKIISLIISALVVVSIFSFFDLIDGNVKSYLLCFVIALAAGIVGLQVMPETVKNPLLFVSVHIATTIALAIMLVFVLMAWAIGNYGF